MTIAVSRSEIAQDHGRPLVGGEPPGEADGEDVRVEDVSGGLDGLVALAAAAALPADAPADEGQQQVLQGVVRFPQLAGVDAVDALPNVRLAHAVHPVGREVAVVELLHLPGQPALDVDAVGDVSDGDFFLDAPGPEVRPHAAGDVAVQVADGVGAAGKLQPQHGHAEGLVLVLRLDPPQAHQLLGRDAQFVAQRAEVLLDQVAVEAVVAGGHGRVGGEDGVLRHLAQGGVEAHAVVLHVVADGLQRGEGAVALVEMIDAGHDAQRLQRAHAADAGDQLLADAGAVVAAVEPGGQLPVGLDCCPARRNPTGRAAPARRASARPSPAVCRCGCRCGR